MAKKNPEPLPKPKKPEAKKEESSGGQKGSTFRLVFVILLAIMALSLYVQLIEYFEIVPEDLRPYLVFFTQTMFILIMAKLLNVLTSPALRRILRMGMEEEESIGRVVSMWEYFIWTIAVILIGLNVVGNLEFFSLFIGLATAGIAFALQQPILSVVGWLTITVKQPFRLGDRIMVQDVKGDVVNLSILYFTLREVTPDDAETPTGKLITIPTSVVLQEKIVNYTRDNKMIWEDITVSVTYESDISLAEKLVKKAAKEVLGENYRNWVDLMRRDYPAYIKRSFPDEPIVHFSFAPSSMDLTVRYVVYVPKKREIESRIISKIFEKFRNEGRKKVTIAYPHIEVVGGKK